MASDTGYRDYGTAVEIERLDAMTAEIARLATALKALRKTRRNMIWRLHHRRAYNEMSEPAHRARQDRINAWRRAAYHAAKAAAE